MALIEDLMAADPALSRALLDTRAFAAKPGHQAIVNIELAAISELSILLQKARSIEHAEQLQKRIRAKWFVVRDHCEGYFLKLPAGHSDGCEHVAEFEHHARDGAFSVNQRARAALWYRYAQRPPPPWL